MRKTEAKIHEKEKERKRRRGERREGKRKEKKRGIIMKEKTLI